MATLIIMILIIIIHTIMTHTITTRITTKVGQGRTRRPAAVIIQKQIIRILIIQTLQEEGHTAILLAELDERSYYAQKYYDNS